MRVTGRYVKIFAAFVLPLLLVTQNLEESFDSSWNLMKPHSLALSPLAWKFQGNYMISRQQVKRELCKVAKIHGLQNRTGMLPYVFTKSTFNSWTMHFLDDWHQNRHRQQLYMPPFPHLSCIPFISHKYKFIYIGIPKTGFRSTKKYIINEVCNGNQTGCLEEIFGLEMTEEQYIQYYKDYFKFSFVRNPYVRAGSVYWMMRGPMKDDNGTRCMPSFDQHCQDPYKLKELCGKYYEFIKTDNPVRDCCCYIKGIRIQNFLDQHLMPQSPCIFDKDGNIMVDFIGKVENFKEDFIAILKEINKRSENQIPVPEEVYHIGKQQEFDARNAGCDHLSQIYLKMYNKNPQCLLPIKKYYQLDFKLFQFTT